MISLSPYNWYFFKAALFLFVVILVVTVVVYLVPLSKTAIALAKKAEAMNQNADAVKTKGAKAKAVLENWKEILKKLAYSYLILSAAKKIYDEDEEAKGVKGYSKSTLKAIQNERLSEKTFKRYQKMFRESR